MSTPDQTKILAFGVAGAALGGTVGYWAFGWALHQGFYALMLPPGLLGLGAGLCARRRSVPLAGLCGVLGLGLALFTEWHYAPFTADPSLGYFLSHLASLRAVTLLMLAVGAFLSYRLALGVDRPAPPAA